MWAGCPHPAHLQDRNAIDHRFFDTASVMDSVIPRSAAPIRSSVVEPPGGLLVWLIVILEVFTFCVGLAIFLLQRRAAPEIFQRGHQTLDQTIALANTVLLITGGWCMANALARLKRNQAASSSRWIGGALLAALGFLGLKSFEYADKLSHGFGLHTDPFFTLYWLLTGFHFLHVATAAAILAWLWFGVHSGRYSATDHADVESGGVFWHLCDLIWLLLYPVIYLLR